MKKSVSIIKKVALTTMCSAWILITCSCRKDVLLSDEEISSNLIGTGGIEGSYDPKLLIGEWEPVMFAYTANGKKIAKIAGISMTDYFGRPRFLAINDYPYEFKKYLMSQLTLPEDLSTLFGPCTIFDYSFLCSISGNLINYRSELNDVPIANFPLQTSFSYNSKIDLDSEQLDILNVFESAHSFVLRGNELIIYFKGDEKRNLLILKKSQKDVIADNLSKNGSLDPTFFMGEWDCKKFAHTADGNKITGTSNLQKGRIRITGTRQGSLDEMLLCAFYTNIKGDLLRTNGKWPRVGVWLGSVDVEITRSSEEFKIFTALSSIYSYVVKGDELIIYFTGFDLLEINENLLICKKRSQQHDLISSNLSRMGNTEPELLVGEWDCVKFAYTSNGNNILNVDVISTTGHVIIPDVKNLSLSISLLSDNLDGIHFNCSFSDNLLKLSQYPVVVPFDFMNRGDDDTMVAFALTNAYSFVVKDDELIIYFIGPDKKNLLILKKR